MVSGVIRREALSALLAGLAGLAGSYAVAGATPAFVGAPVSAFVVRAMPGSVVAVSIVYLGSLGTKLGFLFSLALTAVGLGALSLLGFAAGRRVGYPHVAAILACVLGWLVTAGLTGAPLLALGAGVPMGVAVAGFERWGPAAAPATDEARRRLVVGLGSVAGFGVVAYLLGRGRGGDVGGIGEPSARARIDAARALELDVEGLPGLVSDAEEFYEVDISLVNPTVEAADWRLTVTGAVDTEVTLTYDELTAMPAEHRFVTLRCVGDSLNGPQLDNALWTGVPLGDCLDMATPRGEHVVLRAVDGYDVGFPLAALRTAFLAYRMNGEPLPRKHGHPARALVPGHWGEVNVKWVTEIEVVDEPVDGYWERRGWHGTGPVNTVAKLWAEERDGDRVRVAGHAYAGTRGVSRVEVSIDGGDTWTDARLSRPLPGEDVWRQWVHEYDHPGERHEVVVRAVDGEGVVQPQGDPNPFPRGASGWVTKTIEG